MYRAVFEQVNARLKLMQDKANTIIEVSAIIVNSEISASHITTYSNFLSSALSANASNETSPETSFTNFNSFINKPE